MEETLLPKALRHEHYNSTVNNKTTKVPENPQETMEFLSRSWSASALQVSKALSHQPPQPPPLPKTYSQPLKPHSTNFSTSVQSEGMIIGDMEEDPQLASLNPFSFASSATSQLVLERIMSVSQSSQEISPLTSGRLSHGSEPMNGGNGIQSGGSRNGSDSPPISPHDDLDDVVKLSGGGRSGAGTCPSTPAGGKTVGRWLKERREKKKEENRTHNAQIHAAISVAGVAAAVAAIAAATAASSGSAKDDQTTKTDMAIASAATLVAAQCVEAAEAMGAEREQLGSVVSSAVNVRSHDDIMTLTAAAATATLKARALKEVWNIASVIPVEKGLGTAVDANIDHYNPKSSSSDEIGPGDNVFGICSLELLARGSELLKRTRKGDLHWKIVSVYIHRTGQVMLKMKSRHVGGTITKKKKNIVLEVHKDMPAWPGRPFMEAGEQPRYFGLKTQLRGIVEFECKNQREHDIWTQGVSRLLSIVAQRKKRCRNYN
ncbi:Pleckstrin-like, plant [Dillenia turbinata]|uniref:Pleckstrin-like, plant n=1 Tax=Dillenia turbinata TaxID=194707 RepID=A0AAN8W2Z4_9MAGN